MFDSPIEILHHDHHFRQTGEIGRARLAARIDTALSWGRVPNEKRKESASPPFANLCGLPVQAHAIRTLPPAALGLAHRDTSFLQPLGFRSQIVRPHSP